MSHSLWDDPDVQRIYDVVNGQPWPRFSEFNDHPAKGLVLAFVQADQAAGSDASKAEFLQACVSGIELVEAIKGAVAQGWLKFFVYQVDQNNYFLWSRHRCSAEVAAIAEWTVVTIEEQRWGPDGNASALGETHGNAMALAAEAGGGMRQDPRTGQMAYGDGEAARQAARSGGFDDRGKPLPEPARPRAVPEQEKALETGPSVEALDEFGRRLEAAEDGDAASQLLLQGLMARHLGDEDQALALFVQAAQQGDTEAMLEAGDLYEDRGDLSSAVLWFEAAAQGGHARGVVNAGRAHLARGDLDAAQKWFSAAVSQGDARGHGGLALVAEARGDNALEREHTRRGALAGDPLCMGNHAFFLLSDARERQDYALLAESFDWAERAAEHGEVNAMYGAGLSGMALGREDDARRWFQRAVEAGHPDAAEMLTRFGLD